MLSKAAQTPSNLMIETAIVPFPEWFLSNVYDGGV